MCAVHTKSVHLVHGARFKDRKWNNKHHHHHHHNGHKKVRANGEEKKKKTQLPKEIMGMGLDDSA